MFARHDTFARSICAQQLRADCKNQADGKSPPFKRRMGFWRANFVPYISRGYAVNVPGDGGILMQDPPGSATVLTPERGAAKKTILIPTGLV